jgi:hypothetical protein
VKTNQIIKTTDRYTPLTRVINVDSNGPQEQSEWTSTQNMHKTKKQQKIGIKIPTIVNGRIKHSDDGNPTAARKKTTKATCTNFNNKEHKVKIVGDSHHGETATMIDHHLNTKFGYFYGSTVHLAFNLLTF